MQDKVFNAFAQRKGVDKAALRFLFDGERIPGDVTPKSVRGAMPICSPPLIALTTLTLSPSHRPPPPPPVLLPHAQLDLEETDQIDVLLEQTGQQHLANAPEVDAFDLFGGAEPRGGGGGAAAAPADDENQDTIAAVGGVKAVIAAMRAHAADAAVQQQGCAALRNLAQPSKNPCL
jgi:hypothetical protein